jgi:hypothetical protein
VCCRLEILALTGAIIMGGGKEVGSKCLLLAVVDLLSSWMEVLREYCCRGAPSPTAGTGSGSRLSLRAIDRLLYRSTLSKFLVLGVTAAQHVILLFTLRGNTWPLSRPCSLLLAVAGVSSSATPICYPLLRAPLES